MTALAEFHPLIVHFPIALFILYIFFEVISLFTKTDFFNKAAALILFLGVITGLIASLTGNLAADTVVDKFELVVKKHQEWATMTQWYFTFLLIFRFFLIFKQKFSGYIRYGFVVLALFGIFMVYKTGHYGGKLVYRYGIGTELIDKKLINE